MKKCQNCGTLCPDELERCSVCRMTGRFKKMPGTELPSQQKTEVEGKQCRNCRDKLSEGSNKCPTCNMPVSRQEAGFSKSINGKSFILASKDGAGNRFLQSLRPTFKTKKQWPVEDINFST